MVLMVLADLWKGEHLNWEVGLGSSLIWISLGRMMLPASIKADTLPETKPASLYLKMDAWKTSVLSFWGNLAAYFQGQP